jgi:glycerophosphoryl diester phosphodiesterase
VCSVGDARLDQLRWYGADNEATRVLTVEEALSALRGRGLKTIILDIKDGPPFGTEDFAAKSLAVIAAAQCAECIVWAKEDEVVRDLVRLGRGSQAGFVLMNETADARARGMHKLGRLTGAGIVAAHWAMVDAPLVAAAHARGLRLFGWTANAVQMIDPLVTAGVAAIVTDQARMRSRMCRATPFAALTRGLLPRQPTLVAQRVAALRAPCGT